MARNLPLFAILFAIAALAVYAVMPKSAPNLTVPNVSLQVTSVLPAFDSPEWGLQGFGYDIPNFARSAWLGPSIAMQTEEVPFRGQGVHEIQFQVPDGLTPNDLCSLFKYLYPDRECFVEVKAFQMDDGSRAFWVRMWTTEGDKQLTIMEGRLMNMDLSMFEELGNLPVTHGWISHIKVASWARNAGIGASSASFANQFMKAMSTAYGQIPVHVFDDAAGWGATMMQKMGIPPEKVLYETNKLWVYIID